MQPHLLSRVEDVDNTEEMEKHVQHRDKIVQDVVRPHEQIYLENRRYNRSRMTGLNKNESWQKGDKVLVAKSRSGKYDPYYFGPFTIENIFENGDLQLSDSSVQSPENVKKFEHSQDSEFAEVSKLKKICHSSQLSRAGEYVWFKSCSLTISPEYRDCQILIGAIVDWKLVDDFTVPKRLLSDYVSQNEKLLMWIPSNAEFLWASLETVYDFKEKYDHFVNIIKTNVNLWTNLQIALAETGLTCKNEYQEDHWIHSYQTNRTRKKPPKM
jgi:hypothetical protein